MITIVRKVEGSGAPRHSVGQSTVGGFILLRAAISVLVLFAFWVALSGYFTPFLLAAGLGSAIGVVWFARRMNVVDNESLPAHMAPRALWYWPWLMKEIAKSAWDVAKLVVHPEMPIEPTLVRFRPTQRTHVGLCSHANSITLTPGTITVDVSASEMLVHSLTAAGAEGVMGGAMDRKVTLFEGEH
jgi:multicomponent Na+:H+ antiporter subunit E